jgi:hypothetical protein
MLLQTQNPLKSLKNGIKILFISLVEEFLQTLVGIMNLSKKKKSLNYFLFVCLDEEIYEILIEKAISLSKKIKEMKKKLNF